MDSITLMETLNYVSFALSFIYFIYVVCLLISFYYLSSTAFISSRRPQSSVLMGILSIIGCCISHNFQLVFFNNTTIKYIPYTNIVSFVLVMITAGGLYSITTYRTWLIYYTISWNKAMEDSKWRLYIDPNETNWFLKNKNKYGSSKNVAIILFIHWLFWLILGFVAMIISDPKQVQSPNARMCFALLTIVIIILDVILYRIMPEFKDIYHIRKETILLLRYEIAVVAIYFLLAVLINAQPYSWQYSLFTMVSNLMYVGFASIIYLWVYRQFKLPALPCYSRYIKNLDLVETRISIIEKDNEESSTSTPIGSVDKQKPCKQVQQLRLVDILKTEDGFNCFARHLTREFCLENLLFFIETQQFLHSLRSKPEYKLYFTSNDKLLNVEINDNAPKSRIIQNSDDEKANVNVKVIIQSDEDNGNDYASKNEYIQCLTLFQKYIYNDAYFCVNIDSRSRIQLYTIFGNRDDNNENINTNCKIDKKTLIHAFDEARTQVFQLLSFAFTRFQSTKQYKQLLLDI